MKPLLPIILSAYVFSAPNFANGNACQNELEKIQGNWALVSLDADGAKMENEDLKGSVLVVKGNKYYSKSPQFTEHGTLKLDKGQKPGAIDLNPVDGPLKGQTMLGIYEIDGDNLKACFAEPGKDRPKAFASKPKSNNILARYQRQKP